MGKLRKTKFFVFIIIFLLFLELTLQLFSFFILSNIEKRNLNPEGDFNIVCIGDSFTYGLGAPAKESYPNQLKRFINNAYPGNNINVINLGIPGYNSSQCIEYLKEKFDFYKPKIVIILAGFNNTWNFSNSSYFKNKYKYADSLKYMVRCTDMLLSKSKIYKFNKILFHNLTVEFKSNNSPYAKNHLPPREFPAPKRSAELKELLRKGSAYFEEGKYTVAQVYYRKARELAPDDYEPHWQVGKYYIFSGQREKGIPELVIAAKYATHPYTVSCILSDAQDRHQSRNSIDFQKFSTLVSNLRSWWVKKFGEEYVKYYIDPVLSYREGDLEKILLYDLEELATYLDQRNAKLVILSYPFSANTFRYAPNIYYRISKDLDVPLVDNTSIFDKYLKIYKREELFTADGHCASRGYGIIAENVFVILKQHKLLPSPN